MVDSEMKLILASSSSRRIQLLRMLGIEFEVRKPIYEARLPYASPEESAMFAAYEKARQVAGFYTEGLVIGADTIVVVDGRVLGKPKDENEAKEFLRLLSGRTHKVITGVAIVDAATHRSVKDYEVTLVKFKELTDEEIEWYVSTGEPMDKAGAYAVQGKAAIFIERIEGDYYNVVGLPLNKLYILLKKMGFDIIKRSRGGASQ